MRVGRPPFLQRIAAIIMMAAAAAFTLQGTLIATSQAATGESGRYHHGFAHGHSQAQPADAADSHVLTHVHVDGTVHRHAIDDDDLDDHIKEHGCACCWNMAVAFGVLPSVSLCAVAEIAGGKLPIEAATPLQVSEPDGLRKPPRPPCIA